MGSQRLVLCLFLSGIVAYAQTSTGTISGTVQDGSGAVIAGAEVRIIGSETGAIARVLRTADVGTFAAPLLRPGAYTVEVSHPGFKTLSRTGLVLRVDEVLDLRLILEPGAITEQITVTAEAPLLEESTHAVGQVVDYSTIQQLPLNGRNYLQLGNLTAGTVPNSRSRDKTFSAYGNRGLQNAFLLDGARNQNYLRGLDNRQRDAMRPSLEAIAEFKVQTSNFSAEYGASAGAVVNVVTRGGANEIHGSAFEFLRNSEFDAVDFFQRAGTTSPLFIQHQFGGSLGGPVVRNRAWWYGAFERTHISQETTLTGTVPLPEQRDGIFGSRAVFDPYSTRPNPNGAGNIRDRFPNNTIPASQFDPIGKAQIDKYPHPLLPGTSLNYVTAPLESTRLNNGTFRGDARITDADSMFGRFSFVTADFLKKSVLPEPAATGTLREQPSWSAGCGYTRVFSPTIVNELRFAWNQVTVKQDGTLPRDEIIAGALDPGVTSSTPTFSVTGYTGLGSEPPGFGNLPLIKSSGVWNLSSNLSIIRGKHTLKTGFDWQYIRVTTDTTLSGRGSFGFTGVFSQDPLARPATGSPLADLLLGLPHSINIGTRGVSNERAQNYYWYFQDDWSVTPNLTLNLGIRYDLTRPFIERDNKFANIILDPGDELFGQFLLAGDPRRPRSFVDTDKNNIAPRFGFAWRTPARRVVVRGGYGIFYAQDEGTGVNRRLTNNPPFFGFGGFTVTSNQLNPSSTLPLRGGLPGRPAPVDPASFVFDPRATATLISWVRDFPIGYVQQWSLGIQKEFAGGLLWEVNYVGNRGDKLGGSYPLNQPEPGPGAVVDRRPFRQYTRAPVFRSAPWAFSRYHGVSTRVERRFSKGLSFLGSFTVGRAIDTASEFAVCDGCGASADDAVQNPLDLYGSQKSLSNHHIARRFVFSGIYDLPFGTGRPYANAGAIRHIVGGWAISGIFTASDGIPFTPSLAFDNANTGTTNRPNRLRDGRLDNPTVARYFDIDAFAAAAPFTYGNSGRNILIGPGTNNIDFAVHRNFPLPINEASRLEFRAEAFNLFNRPHFDLPNSTIGSVSAGIIGATTTPNRQLQFGLKLVF
jgi:outer membrane receptor protein involved in Fe transport